MKDNRKISEMLNLGPKTEKDFNEVGIYTAQQLIKLGVYKAFDKLIEGRMKSGRSMKCFNAIYLYAIYGAIENIDWMDIPEKKKLEFKSYTKKLRSI